MAFEETELKKKDIKKCCIIAFVSQEFISQGRETVHMFLVDQQLQR